ncbi:MAG TPA: hypothetical protein DF613_02675 [Lachnospiraceae bacterium]|nr:hypothetical protein [Lachnospiraceae bacterium]
MCPGGICPFEVGDKDDEKKIFGLGLLFFCLCLSGCGAKKQADSVEEEPVKLTLMTPNRWYSGFEDVINEQFPGVELEVMSYLEEQYYTVLKTKLATGSGPGLIIWQDRISAMWRLIPLESRWKIPRWPIFIRRNFMSFWTRR